MACVAVRARNQPVDTARECHKRGSCHGLCDTCNYVHATHRLPWSCYTSVKGGALRKEGVVSPCLMLFVRARVHMHPFSAPPPFFASLSVSPLPAIGSVTLSLCTITGVRGTKTLPAHVPAPAPPPPPPPPPRRYWTNAASTCVAAGGCRCCTATNSLHSWQNSENCEPHNQRTSIHRGYGPFYL